MTTPDEECRKAFEKIYPPEQYVHSSPYDVWQAGWLARVPTRHCVVKEETLKDAKRYQWLKENRDVLLITGFFGNGCINKTIGDAEFKIDAMLAASQGGKDAKNTS